MGIFSESDGLGWNEVEDVLHSGANLYSKISGAKVVGAIQEKQISASVEIEKERTKKILYLGFGMLGVLLIIRLFKPAGMRM